MATKRRGKPPIPMKALRTQASTRGQALILSPLSARQIERRYKVMELRRQGCTLPEIATTLDINTQTVKEDLEAILSQAAKDMMPTEMDRAMEIERFDALLRKYQPLAEAGNMAAASLCLSISDRRRKLLALDKPEQKNAEETAVRVYVGINTDDV